jgi:hypothetical protein
LLHAARTRTDGNCAKFFFRVKPASWLAADHRRGPRSPGRAARRPLPG